MLRPAGYQYNPRTIKYPEWPIIDFSGGLNNKVEDNLIKDNQCADASNVICRTIGQMESRPGQAKLNSVDLGGAIQGLYPYYYSGNRKLICVSNGIAYYWDPGTIAWVSFKTGLNTTSKFAFETAINYMVAMDGVGVPWKYDGTAASNLLNAPALGKCPVWWREKLFCIADSDTVQYSYEQQPENWPAVNNKKFTPGDGDSIVLITPYGNGRELLVCKKQKIFHLTGYTIDDFDQTCVEPNFGVAGLFAGIVVEPYFYYACENGVMQWTGLRSVNLTENSIPKTWATVNKSALANIVISYNEPYNHLEVHVPTGASTTPNKTLIYDLNLKSWWPFDGIYPSCMTQYNDGTNIKTYIGHATLGFVIERNTGFDDYGTAITGYWQGKNFDANDQSLEKKIKKAFVHDINGGNDMTYQYRVNDGTFVSPTAQTDRNGERKFRISAKCRRFQPKLTFSSSTVKSTCSGMKTIFDPGRSK